MKIALHKIGNKINGEDVSFSDELLSINEETQDLLLNYFLGSFKSEETYQFYHESYLPLNSVYENCFGIFDNPSRFIEFSSRIGRCLFEAAENPRIQGGELFVVYFKAESENEVDKIGLFKTEKRESFLNIFIGQDDPIEVDKGVSLAKIDKAALIFNQDKETGYVLQVVDNNKNGDMYYWYEDFLKVKQREDNYYHTQESMEIIKDFVKKQIGQEFEITKPDMVYLLNKTVKYFQEKEEFNIEEFGNEVLEQPEIIESFNEFKTDYEQEMQINIAESFPINNTAVKKSQKHFKSIIKLDKNFHLYIHGDKKFLEKGTDEKGNFYKLYFEKEV